MSYHQYHGLGTAVIGTSNNCSVSSYYSVHPYCTVSLEPINLGQQQTAINALDCVRHTSTTSYHIMSSTYPQRQPLPQRNTYQPPPPPVLPTTHTTSNRPGSASKKSPYTAPHTTTTSHCCCGSTLYTIHQQQQQKPTPQYI